MSVDIRTANRRPNIMRIAITFLFACFVTSAGPVYLVDTELSDPFHGCTFAAITNTDVFGWCVEAYDTPVDWHIGDPIVLDSPYFGGLSYQDISYRLQYIPPEECGTIILGLDQQQDLVGYTGCGLPGNPPGYAVTGGPDGYWTHVATEPPLV